MVYFKSSIASAFCSGFCFLSFSYNKQSIYSLVGRFYFYTCVLVYFFFFSHIVFCILIISILLFFLARSLIPYTLSLPLSNSDQSNLGKIHLFPTMINGLPRILKQLFWFFSAAFVLGIFKTLIDMHNTLVSFFVPQFGRSG